MNLEENITLKVCHITSDHPQFDVRIFHKECTSLAQMGHETYLISQGETCIRNGVNLIGLGIPPQKTLNRIFNFTKKAYTEALKIDANVYHLHDPELLPYGLMLKAKGKKVVYDSHENLHSQILQKHQIPKCLRHIFAKIYNMFLIYACKKFDAIVTVEPIMKKFYSNINPHTVMVTNYPIYEENTAKNTLKKCAKFSIGFAGGLTEQWNHENIVKALGRFNNVKYKLCGRGNFEYMKRLEELTGWSQVEYIGMLPHSEALTMLESCDLGVALCSYSNNTNGRIGSLGNTKIFEIMMAGLPVLCTEFNCWKEIIHDWNCGICIDYNDINAIENAVLFLMENPDIAKEMGRMGRMAIAKKYNWQQQEKELRKLYHALI